MANNQPGGASACTRTLQTASCPCGDVAGSCPIGNRTAGCVTPAVRDWSWARQPSAGNCKSYPACLPESNEAGSTPGGILTPACTCAGGATTSVFGYRQPEFNRYPGGQSVYFWDGTQYVRYYIRPAGV